MEKITIQSEKIKWFALLAMTFDHIGRIFPDTPLICDTLGRTAFPIFSYLLISNFCTYHNAKKYILRLGFFAVLTQIILYRYDFQNILFSFLYAIVFLSFVENLCKMTKSFIVQAYFSLLLFLILAPLIIMADYGLAGFVFLIALYGYLKNKTKLNYAAVLLTSVIINCSSFIAAFSGFATTVLLLSFVKIENSKRLMKWWFFYVYYPLHRLIIFSLKTFLGI